MVTFVQTIFVQATFVLVTFVHIRNISFATGMIWTKVTDDWHLLKMVLGTFHSSLVKIRSVTAEIFLIWTNVARTNVALTNVTVTV